MDLAQHAEAEASVDRLLPRFGVPVARRAVDLPGCRIHYLDAPILLRIDPLRDESQAHLFGYGGLAPAIHLWCHEQGIRADTQGGPLQPVPYSDACGSWDFYPQAPNRFDLGAVVGVGAGWRRSFGTFEIQLRFVHGLIPSGAWGAGHNEAFSLLFGFGRTL